MAVKELVAALCIALWSCTATASCYSGHAPEDGIGASRGKGGERLSLSTSFRANQADWEDGATTCNVNFGLQSAVTGLSAGYALELGMPGEGERARAFAAFDDGSGRRLEISRTSTLQAEDSVAYQALWSSAGDDHALTATADWAQTAGDLELRLHGSRTFDGEGWGRFRSWAATTRRITEERTGLSFGLEYRPPHGALFVVPDLMEVTFRDEEIAEGSGEIAYASSVEWANDWAGLLLWQDRDAEARLSRGVEIEYFPFEAIPAAIDLAGISDGTGTEGRVVVRSEIKF
ncbi:MAG TPA: hypothetical protein VFM24_09970 [Nitrospira sp.]|nr:hypothetical protein [Nitrospira sp.]